MAEYNTWRGYPVGEEITDLRGWQKEAREKLGMRFFEPIPPAQRPLRDGQGDFVTDHEGNIMKWTAELAAEYSTRSVRAEAVAATAGGLAVDSLVAPQELEPDEPALGEVIELRPAA